MTNHEIIEELQYLIEQAQEAQDMAEDVEMHRILLKIHALLQEAIE